MDTKNARTKTMPKMQIAILEQTEKKRGRNKMTPPISEIKEKKTIITKANDGLRPAHQPF